MSKLSFAFVLALSAFFVSAGGNTAKADTIDYLLNLGNNPGLNPTNSGPYGDVLVNLTSPTTATFTFTAYTGFLFAQQGAAGVNLNATSWTVSPGFGGTNSLTGFTAGSAAN